MSDVPPQDPQQPQDADARVVEALRTRDLVFVRTAEDRSLVVQHEGRDVVVFCTDRSRLGAWWAQHAGPDAAAPFVREMPFRQVVGLWASEHVDLLVDPGPGGGVVVPVAPARRQLGMGPIVVDGDGSEPLRFAGFGQGRAGVRLPLLVIVLGVVLLVVGIVSGSWVSAVVGLAGIGAALALGHKGFSDVAAARAATQRVRESQRGAGSS
jgi:hypothetical protein